MRIAGIALAQGGFKRGSLVTAPWEPYCDAPITVSRGTSKGAALARGVAGCRSAHVLPLDIALRVPCRRCVKCRTVKHLHWFERCEQQLKNSPRTWFQTLTFDDDRLHYLQMRAKSNSLKSGRPVTVEEERIAYHDVRLWLARLRKPIKGVKPELQFVYFCCAELGEKRGRLHYHLFLHELHGRYPIRKSYLERSWPAIQQARLVRHSQNGECAYYITKYLTKSLWKPKASKFYGTVKAGAQRTKMTPSESKRNACTTPRHGGGPPDEGTQIKRRVL